MLNFSKIDDYLKILTDAKFEDFIPIHFSEYFKSTREEQNLRKVAKSYYFFLTIPDEIEKYMQPISSDNYILNYNVEIFNLFDPELQLISFKPNVIKKKLKELLRELKKV